MGEGIEIPDEVVEAAAKAMVVREAIGQGRSPEEAELRWQGVRDDVRWPYRLNAHVALQAALDALGATVERKAEYAKGKLRLPPTASVPTDDSGWQEIAAWTRLVTAWRSL